MTPTVRAATVDDAETIREIARESWHAAYDGILGAETVDETIDDWYAIPDLESSIRAAADGDARLLVAEAADGRRVGFAHAGPDPEDDDVAVLARLYVRPDAWGEGAGTALLERVETAVAPSCDRLRLSVLADNGIGVSFYESRGFDRIETRSTDLGDGIDEAVYEKGLDPG